MALQLRITSPAPIETTVKLGCLSVYKTAVGVEVELYLSDGGNSVTKWTNKQLLARRNHAQNAERTLPN